MQISHCSSVKLAKAILTDGGTRIADLARVREVSTVDGSRARGRVDCGNSYTSIGRASDGKDQRESEGKKDKDACEHSDRKEQARDEDRRLLRVVFIEDWLQMMTI